MFGHRTGGPRSTRSACLFPKTHVHVRARRALERLWPKPWESTAAGDGILTNIPEKSKGLSVDQS